MSIFGKPLVSSLVTRGMSSERRPRVELKRYDPGQEEQENTIKEDEISVAQADWNFFTNLKSWVVSFSQ